MADSRISLSNLIPILLGDESPKGVSEILLDYDQVKEFHAQPIQSLCGIEVFSDLKVISVRNQQLQDLKGLQSLSGLVESDFTGNQLKEIRNEDFPKSLRRLFLNFNTLDSIEKLDAHPNLQEIHLNGNTELDSPLKGDFPSLQILNLSGNILLKSVEALLAFKNLKELYLKQLKLKDWHILTTLPSIHTLSVSAFSISQWNKLAPQTTLKKLFISSGSTESVTLPILPNLEELKLTHCTYLSEIKGWENLPGLQKLDLRYNQLREIPDVANLPNLQEIDLRFNPISDSYKMKEIPEHIKIRLN